MRTKTKHYLGDDFSQFNGLVGKEYSIKIGNTTLVGVVRNEHPDFDWSLVRGGVYFGKVNYYLEVLNVDGCYESL